MSSPCSSAPPWLLPSRLRVAGRETGRAPELSLPLQRSQPSTLLVCGRRSSENELTTKRNSSERTSPTATDILPSDSQRSLPSHPLLYHLKAFLSTQQKAASPLGWGPYQSGYEVGLSATSFISSPHPHFITQGSSPSPPCHPRGAPGGERGRHLNQWDGGGAGGGGENRGTAGRGFPGTWTLVLTVLQAQGGLQPWWQSRF